MKINLRTIARIVTRVAPLVVAAVPVVKPIFLEVKAAIRDGKTPAERS